MNNIPLPEPWCGVPKDAKWIFEDAAWGAKTLRLIALVCQPQMDAAKACRHSLDVVVQALMKERGGRASTGRYAPHLVVLLCPTCANYATWLFVPGVQTPTTNRRGGRVVCTGAYAKQFQHQCLKLSDFRMADSDVGLLLHLKTTETCCCYNNISVSELKLTLRVTSRPELEWLPAGLCANEAG